MKLFTVILLTALVLAKTVTSLFTLLSVLGFRCNILFIQAYFLFYSFYPGSKVSLVMIPASGWNAGLARGQLADDAHRPVLQISKKQNRELSYASCRW